MIDELSRGMRNANLFVDEGELVYRSKSASWASIFRGKLGQHQYNIHSISELGSSQFSSDFVPAFAAVNGFYYNDKLWIYLLAVPKEGINKGVLTLDKYQFGMNIQQYESETEKLENLSWLVHEKILPKFIGTMQRFQESEIQLKQIPLSGSELTAIMLDMLNLNRDTESLESDRGLKRNVTNTLNIAKSYFDDKKNCHSLLTFLAAHQQIVLSRSLILKNEVENVLIEKKAYKTILRRLLEGKNQDAVERRKYIHKQRLLMANVKAILVKEKMQRYKNS